jgi:hypothetical protein
MGRGQQRNNRNTSYRVLLLFLYLLLPPPPLRCTVGAIQVTFNDDIESPKQEDWFDSLFRLKPIDEQQLEDGLTHNDVLIQNGGQIQDGSESRKNQNGGHNKDGADFIQDGGDEPSMKDYQDGGKFQRNVGFVYQITGPLQNGSHFIQDGDHAGTRSSYLYLEKHRVVVKCCPVGQMLESDRSKAACTSSSSAVNNFTGTTADFREKKLKYFFSIHPGPYLDCSKVHF